jgi:hypothetical protein
MINEHKKGFKAKKYASKTKSTEPATVGSPVAKAAQKVAKGSGRHKNPKDALVKPRLAKHKKDQGVAEESNTVKKDPKTGKVKSWSHEGDWEKVNSKKDPKGKVHNLTGQALKKTKELNLEEDQMGLGYDLDNLYESKLQMMLDEAVKQTALGKFRSEADKRNQKHDQIAAKQTKDGSGMSSAIDRLEKHVNTKESSDGGSEYNDEVGMIRNDLHTMVRCASELNEILKRDENVAEWVQEKIAVAKSMMVTILDYVASEHEMGNVYRK